MQFPLSANLDVLRTINAIIPEGEFTDIDVNSLSMEEVDAIIKYATIVLPEQSLRDKFAVFKISADHLDILYNKLSKFDLVIAPGDSPSKYILSLKLCGFSLPVLQFPLSGLGRRGGISESSEMLLKGYMDILLQRYTNVGNIAIFDYSSSGATVRYLTKAIKISLGRDVNIEHIEIPDTTGKNEYENTYEYVNEHTALMLEGDRYCTRCVSKFNVDGLKNKYPSIIPSGNVMKCNIICLMVALAFAHKLNVLIEIPKFDIDTGVYTAIYYHPEENKIIEGLIQIKYYQLFSPIIDVNQYMEHIHSTGCNPFMCLIELKELLSVPIKKHTRKIRRAELINEEIVDVYIPKYGDAFGYLTPLDTEEALKELDKEKLNDEDYSFKKNILRLNDNYYSFKRIEAQWIVAI